MEKHKLEAENRNLKAQVKLQNEAVLVVHDPIQRFLLNTGQVTGALMRDDVKAYLRKHGSTDEDIKRWMETLMEIAEKFYA